MRGSSHARVHGSILGPKNAIDWASARHRGSWLRNKTVAVAGATTGQYGAIWAQQDLKRVLGIAGARVVGGELPVATAHEKFDAHGRLVDPLLAERLREHLALPWTRRNPPPRRLTRVTS